MNGSWVRLRLDVERFEPDAFAVAVDRCRREGIRFTTLAALGDDDLHRRRLYELNRVCSADIPGRGDFSSYAEYVAERIEVPSFDPDTVVLALDGDGWVGMSAASDHRDLGYFFNEMTGVVRSHRGRGIALAMKVLVIERVHTLRGARDLHRPPRGEHRADRAEPQARLRRHGRPGVGAVTD